MHTEVGVVQHTYRLVGEEPSLEAMGDGCGRAERTADGNPESREGGVDRTSREGGEEAARSAVTEEFDAGAERCGGAELDGSIGGDQLRGVTGSVEAADEAGAKAEAYLARRRQERNEAIDRLVAEASARGHHAERAFWAMIYDFERAPRTTNRAQLAALGVELPASGELADDEIAAHLWTVIESLARLGVYLMNTDHLTDRQLYERLEGEVIDEDVPDIVGNDGTQEWVDLSTLEEQEIFDELYGGSPERRAMAPGNRDARLPRPPGHIDTLMAPPMEVEPPE